MHEPDVFDGAYGRLAATRLAPGRGPFASIGRPVTTLRVPPHSRLLPRLALTPPRAAWRQPGDAAGRSLGALPR